MPTLSAGSTATDIIQPGQALTVTCDATATASVVEVGAPGAAPGTPTAVAAGASYIVQATTSPRYFRISAAAGSVSYTVAAVPAGVSQGFSNTGELPASGTVLDLQSDQVTCDAVLTRYGAATGPAWLTRHARGTKAAPTATQSGDVLGVWGARGRGATGWITGSKGSFRVTAAETWTDSATGTNLQFLTTPNGSTTAAARMTITQDGSVGMGTTSPSYPLSVKTETNSQVGFTYQNAGSGSGGGGVVGRYLTKEIGRLDFELTNGGSGVEDANVNVYTVGNGTLAKRLSVASDGKLSVGAIAQIPEYADDTAAQAGGLAVGAFYRTGSALKVRAA